MSLSLTDLPEDPVALRAFATQLQAELVARDGDLHAKALQIEKLKMQLAILRRQRFGRSSEKLDTAIEQLELAIGDLEEAEGAREAREIIAAQAEDKAAPSAPRAARKPPGRKPLPEHLPRERLEHEPTCPCPTCGGLKFTKIGVDEREVLEYVPAHFKVIVHVRPKLSCRACETILQAPMPSLPIERGRPGPNLIAHVLISKYCDHLPLYRQSGIYARAHVDLDRSTLADWVGAASVLLEPLAQAIGRYVCNGSAVHADDTTVPVLDPGRGRTKTGRLWVAVRDERPWQGAPPAAFYRYSPDRGGTHALELLKSVRGFLHADGYAGFEQLYERRDAKTQDFLLQEIACWAHARRKLFDIHKAHASPAAGQALELIAQLYAVEAMARGQSPQTRLALRQKHAQPLLTQIRALFDTTLAKISGKSLLAGAIRYAISRWDQLTRYTTDGRLEIDNNAAERAIRPLTLGRKNYLFAGSDAGGERAAILYTIIETAKLNAIEPHAYLTDIVARIADHPSKRINELMPWNWKPIQPALEKAA